MTKPYFQSSRFSATKAQIDYLRAIHHGTPIKTNGATRQRSWPFLTFSRDEDGNVTVSVHARSRQNL